MATGIVIARRHLCRRGNPGFFCHAEQVLRIFLVDHEINSG
ncbi:hypothetical protein [Rickettsia endosymbiont of Orchestes rusci]